MLLLLLLHVTRLKIFRVSIRSEVGLILLEVLVILLALPIIASYHRIKWCRRKYLTVYGCIIISGKGLKRSAKFIFKKY